jgi:hypothetical protein
MKSSTKKSTKRRGSYIPKIPSLRRLSLNLSLSSSKSKTICRKFVNFGSINIREYEIQPSDHPGCHDHNALELGWKYNILVDSIAVDEFEGQRENERLDMYEKKPLPPNSRKSLLTEFGFTEEEIAAANAHADELKKVRERSVKRFHEGLDGVDLFIENIGRACKQLMACCKASSVEDKKMTDVVRLHPSVLKDSTVDARSFFVDLEEGIEKE